MIGGAKPEREGRGKRRERLRGIPVCITTLLRVFLDGIKQVPPQILGGKANEFEKQNHEAATHTKP